MAKLIKHAYMREGPGLLSCKKFLTFSLGSEEYAIDVLKVNEIKSSADNLLIRKVADVPAHIVGLINLHDNIIPIIDLRIFYHIDHIKTDHIKPNIIKNSDVKIVVIVDILHHQIGIVVDAVFDIIDLTDEEIKPAPDFFSIINKNYIQGIGTKDKKILIILDIEKLLSSDEMQIHLLKAKDAQ